MKSPITRLLAHIPLHANRHYFGWMSLAGASLSPTDGYRIAVAIMDGHDADLAMMLMREKGVYEPLLGLTAATHDHVHSAWTLASLREAPSATIDSDPDGSTLRAWYAHYRLLALRSLGKAECDEGQTLATRRQLSPSIHFAAEDVLDFARRDMRMGRSILAEKRLSTFFSERARTEETSFSLSFLFGAFQTWGTCLQVLGRYSDAGLVLEAQRQICRLVPSRFLNLLLLRREGSLLVESERHREAAEFFPMNTHLFEDGRYHVQTTLFLQEWLRHALAVGDDAAISSLFARIESHVAERGISRSFLNMDEERCVRELRESGPSMALIAKFSATLAENRARGDVAATCVVARILARLYLLRNRFAHAEKLARESLELAERWGFGRARVEGLCILAGVLKRRDKLSEATARLREAREISRSISLVAFESALACAEEALTCGGRPTVAALLRAHEAGGSFERVRGVLVELGVDSLWDLTSRPFLGREDVGTVWEILQRVQRHAASLFLPEEGVLVATRGNDTRISVGLPLAQLALFSAFVGAGSDGLFAFQVHGILYPNIVYVSGRHKARAHMAISRLRRTLLPGGIAVRFDSIAERYVLVPDAPLIAVDSKVQSHSALDVQVAGHTLTPRQREILAYLRMRGRARVTTMTMAFSCSRQALHGSLRALQNLGAIRREGKGPASTYVFLE